jgi:hypothetical protein
MTGKGGIMKSGLFRKMKMSTVVIILFIIVFPFSETFSGDRKTFSNDDLNAYRYGNGKAENTVIKKETGKTSKKTKTTRKAKRKEDPLKRKFNTIDAKSGNSRALQKDTKK